jgi:predicted metal-dependent hydrolase
MIGYTLTRSKRKTVAIYIRAGTVEVRAPLKMPLREINKFLASKEKWVTDTLAKTNERVKQREAFTLNYSDTAIYRGRQYPITARNGNSVGFDDDCFYVPTELEPTQIKAACVQIYRILAKQHLTERTALFAQTMKVSPAAVKVNSAMTRWGSCSGKTKNINYSWRLVMASDDIIDYVVVHELAHLAHMNHSTKFWAVVAGILPDFRERKAGLRELQKRLSVEDWDS